MFFFQIFKGKKYHGAYLPIKKIVYYYLEKKEKKRK
jgi:hypothetical protein